MVFRSADEINASLATDFGYVDPPFKGAVTEFITDQPEQFVRFHNIANKNGAWIMKVTDVQHLTELQIRNLFSIPPGNPIPKVSYVDVPIGTKLHGGNANGLYGFDGYNVPHS